ncbi:MAG: xanthine dehydrogenase family protein molybdopterin-binding subunit, partial [Nitrospinota bacterium]
LRPRAPSLHPGGNLLAEKKIKRGDVEAAFREADLIVENTYQLPMVQHAYLEPDGALALPQAGGKLKVLCASKDPHRDHEEVAQVLGLSPEAIALEEVAMGGGFGGKLDPPVIIFAALLAQRTGHPVKLIYSREESFQATCNRHPFTVHYTTAARKDGRIIAARVRALADTGAYATVGSITLTRATIHSVGPYRVPNVDIHLKAVYTNNPISGAMRGFGVPQIALAHESQMDEVARRLGLSPWEIRKLNALREGDTTATGQRLDASVGIMASLEAVERRAGPERLPRWGGTAKKRGRGVGCAFFGIGATGHPNPARCRMEAGPEGELILWAGATELGQGSHTALLQIAADSLGLGAEEVRLAAINTGTVPDAGVTAASRITYMVGRSVKGAAEGLREILFGKAAELLEIDRRDLSFRNGFFSSVSLPRKRLPLKEVARACWEQGSPPRAEGYYEAPITALTPEDGQGVAYATYAFATQAAEVEVDTETGVVEVLKIAAAHDVGRAINPALIEGQVEGGCAMGAGYALTEEVLLEEGRMINEELTSYLLPTSLDAPEVQMRIVEAAEPTGPFGAKGVGEAAMIATAPAILNAIYDAVGVRLRELPATPERVLAALKGKG